MKGLGIETMDLDYKDIVTLFSAAAFKVMASTSTSIAVG